MNRKQILGIGIAACFGMAQNAIVSADTPIDMGAMYGDFNASPGYEIAIPYWKMTDANQDGYPEYFAFQYRVYTVGTNTLLYSSTPKTFFMPELPTGCSQLNGIEWDFSPKFNRRDTSTRINTGLALFLGCWDGAAWHELNNTAVYSAGVNQTGGNAWRFNFNGADLVAINGVDTDGDGITDSNSVVMALDVPAGGTNLSVAILDGATGALKVPIFSYPAVR